MLDRREFLTLGAAVAAAAAAGAAAAQTRPAAQPLDLLVLGGTGFLGPHQIEYALARGHRVTMFNRGTRPNPWGERVEQLIGDRDDKVGKGLAALRAGDRRWDVVIDNTGYLPRHVRDSAAALADRVGRYLFVSTVAVYDFAGGARRFDEASPLAVPVDPRDETESSANYGPMKAESERELRKVLGERATIVRPTYILGPGDDTDRFIYWIERVRRGGDVLGPPNRDFEWQWVDVRDLCGWLVELAEERRPGTFNAAGPAAPISREAVLQGLRALTAEPVRFHWPSAELVKELAIPMPMIPSRAGSIHFVSDAGRAAGLKFRSLADTATAMSSWWQALPEERRASGRKGWPTAAQEAVALERMR
jgi:2'-hydroxyisoflavone reductase